MFYDPLVDTRSLYIHWPFCPYRCHFCPFVALASHDQFMGQYHNALIKEIEIFAQKMGKIQEIDTIFFGGGTPSTYPDHLLLDTFGILKNKFLITDQTEITIEVNPGTVRPEQLSLWKELGVNRLSIGVQSLKDGVLQKLNRLQSIQDVYNLLEIAPVYCKNISVDLILGLPEVLEDEWKLFMQEIVQWPIQHMSVYFLTIHEDTPLYFKVAKKDVVLPEDDAVVELYYWTRTFLMKHGFIQYELSNFAKEGFESRHNTVYWDRKPYKAFGLGACSFDGVMRSQNNKNLMQYMQKVSESAEIVTFSEILTEKQVYCEKIMLNLRRSKGVLWSDLNTNLFPIQQDELQKRISLLQQQGFIEEYQDRIKLTVRGLVVENEIISRLLF